MIRRMLVCFVFLMTASVVLADSWLPVSTVDVPTARAAHSAVFTRIDGTDQMIVWDNQCAIWAPRPPGDLDGTRDDRLGRR